MLLSKALCFWSAKTLPVWWPQSMTLIAKLLRIKWARQTAGTDLFVSSSPSFATIQHRLMQLGSEWMVEQTPAGECTSNSERISQNHLADEWRPLPRWKLLIVHLAKLGSWVIGNFFKNVFYSPPSLACLWLLKTDVCEVTVVTDACRSVGEAPFSMTLWHPQCTLSRKMPPCYSLPTSRQLSVVSLNAALM